MKDLGFRGQTTAAKLTTYSGGGGKASSQQVWIKATDSAGGSSTEVVSFKAFYDPIVIDLDNDGLEFIDLAHSAVRFVTDESGEARRIAWIGGDDGMLAWDVDGNGQIHRFDEIAFGSHVDPENPGMSDLQALQHAVFDSNQDGVFDASDDKWSQFRLWRDRNSNGQSDEGELQTLQEAGIRQLYLNGNVLNRFEGPDALVRGYTRVVTDDDRWLQAADVWLNVDDGSRADAPAPTPAPAHEATAIEADRLTALLKQLADTPADSNHAPLLYGYLPTQYADEGDFFRLEIAPNFFIDPDGGDRLAFTATLADGSPLPDWLSFDPQRLRFEGMPAGTDAARLQVVLRATDPQQTSTEAVFDLIVSPAFEVPEEFVTLDESLWQPPAVQTPQTTQDSQWNALLPMEVLFPTNTSAETSGSDLLSASSWPQNVSDPASTFIPEVGSLSDATLDQPASSLDSAAAAAVAAITTAGQTIAELYHDFIREDFIRGTSGDDRYEVSPGAGWQTLLDPDGNDLLRIALSDPEADLRFERQDNDLHMSFTGTNDGLRIAGWYERNEAGAATHQIERFQLADGRTLLGADIEPLIAAQSITGSSSVTQFWR